MAGNKNFTIINIPKSSAVWKLEFNPQEYKNRQSKLIILNIHPLLPVL